MKTEDQSLPAAADSRPPCKNRAEAVSRLIDALGYVVIAFPSGQNLVSVRDCVKNYMGEIIPGKYFEVIGETDWDEFDATAQILGVKNPFGKNLAAQFVRAVLIDIKDTQEFI